MTEFLTSCALARPRISVRKSSRRSDQRRPPRATDANRRCTASSRGEYTNSSNRGRRRCTSGSRRWRGGACAGPTGGRSEERGPQGGQDQAQVAAEYPVVVQDGHLVELAADLLRDGLAPLGLARLAGGVEPGLEQADQKPRDGHVEAENALDVALAEGGARLPQVLG